MLGLQAFGDILHNFTLHGFTGHGSRGDSTEAGNPGILASIKLARARTPTFSRVGALDASKSTSTGGIHYFWSGSKGGTLQTTKVAVCEV